MNKSFMTFLGTTIICATIGTVTKVSGEATLSAITFTIATISAVTTILLMVNCEFFKTLNKHATAWLFSALGFGILGFYLKTLGAEYRAMTLVTATISAISIISAISHGFYPKNVRAGSLLTIALNLALYIPITWLILGGQNGVLELFKARIADQSVNVIAQDIKAIDALIIIFMSIFKGGPIKINSVLSFPHLILIIHIAWNFFKFMRSYGWVFIASSVTMPFIIIAWTAKHIPRTPGIGFYFGILISLAASAAFILSLRKHWSNPVT